MIERERKFLVARRPHVPDQGVDLRQGYLALDGSVSVRVRDAGPAGCTLTVKSGRGAVRTELEWPLTAEEFERLWPDTEGRRITKTRHRIALPPDEKAQVHVVELDIFHGVLEGFVVAEVEFDSDAALAAFSPPEWFAREVTDDMRYTNASLALHGWPTDGAVEQP